MASRLDDSALIRQKTRNRLRSLALLAGMTLWMALVGWLAAGDLGVLWAAGGTALLLLAQPVRSTTLLRALYGARPLSPFQAPDLHAVVAELSRRAGLERVPELLLIPRPQLAALSTGWGRDGAVALSEGMIRLLDGRELVAVLAHEISHLRAGDLRLLRLAEATGRLTRTLALTGMLLIAVYWPELEVAGAVPLLPLVLLAAAPLVGDLLILTLSRTREFDADAGAAELTGDPEALASALTRLELIQGGGWERLRARPPMPGWLRLIRTHPTTAERLARLRELAPPQPPRWLVLPPVSVMLPGVPRRAAWRSWR